MHSLKIPYNGEVRITFNLKLVTMSCMKKFSVQGERESGITFLFAMGEALAGATLSFLGSWCREEEREQLTHTYLCQQTHGGDLSSPKHMPMIEREQ